MQYIKILGNENLYDDVFTKLAELKKECLDFWGIINMHGEASPVLNACLLNYVIWYYDLADGEKENEDTKISDMILQRIYDYAETVPESEELLKTIEENKEIERQIKELWGDKEE